MTKSKYVTPEMLVQFREELLKMIVEGRK